MAATYFKVHSGMKNIRGPKYRYKKKEAKRVGKRRTRPPLAPAI